VIVIPFLGFNQNLKSKLNGTQKEYQTLLDEEEIVKNNFELPKTPEKLNSSSFGDEISETSTTPSPQSYKTH